MLRQDWPRKLCNAAFADETLTERRVPGKALPKVVAAWVVTTFDCWHETAPEIDPRGQNGHSVATMTGQGEGKPPQAARCLVPMVPEAALGTGRRAANARPYSALVSVGTDHDGSPLLLLADPTDHASLFAIIKPAHPDANTAMTAVSERTDWRPDLRERLRPAAVVL